MSKTRHFAHITERVEGALKSVARLKCRTCGVSSAINLAANGSRLPPDAIVKLFVSKGWTVGNNEQWDFCPSHDPRKKEKPALKLIRQEVEAQKPEEPRKMGREDRRIIFEKLNEVYLNEAVGYETGWSDHRVATDLGVPRKWVEQIRDENFGAIGTNPEMSEFLTEAERLIGEARSILLQCRKAREDIDAILKQPDFVSLHYISDRIGAVERLADKVKKLVV